MMIVAEDGAVCVGVGDGVGVGVGVALADGVGEGDGVVVAKDGARTPEPAVAAIMPVTTAMRRQAPADTPGVSHAQPGSRCKLANLPEILSRNC